jgi:hypothetical protein
MRDLSELALELERDKTILHSIAIDLGLIKNDNFIFQYDFSDYGDWGDKKSYSIISPTNNVIIRIPKDEKELENLPYRVVKKLNEYGFKTNLVT